MKTVAIFFLIFVSTFAFAQTEQASATAAQTPAAESVEQIPVPRPAPLEIRVKGLWDARVKMGAEWTVMTAKALLLEGQELLESRPADAANFCPGYNRLDNRGRLNFWVNFIVAMAYKESAYKPADFYKENFVDSSGKRVVSRGLLQLSKESVQYYDCGLKDEMQLHDPQMNVECGIKILNHWIPRHNRIAGKGKQGWLGGARYWGVLRTPKTLTVIQSMTKQSPGCQK